MLRPILQYKVSLLLTELAVAFVLFIFMLAYCCVFCVATVRLIKIYIIGNESVPMQLTQCRFPWLAISNAEM